MPGRGFKECEVKFTQGLYLVQESGPFLSEKMQDDLVNNKDFDLRKEKSINDQKVRNHDLKNMEESKEPESEKKMRMSEIDEMRQNPYLVDRVKHMESPVYVEAVEANRQDSDDFFILDTGK